MRIYPELKKIAGANARVKDLVKKLEEVGLDCGDLILQGAYLIDGCKEKNGKLFKDGKRLDNHSPAGPDDDYYCCQHTGYCEDCYYGTLYFKTNVPGQFVAVPFEM